jgi:Protein of unknown function (DUF4232)
MPDLDERLAALSALAGRAATLPAAADVRRRGHRRTVRHRAVVAGVAAVLVAGAGWGILSRSDPPIEVGPIVASSRPPAPTPSHPPASAGPSFPGGSSAPTGSPPSRTATCRKADVDLSLGSGAAGSGHRSIALIFTNRSARPCRITGYPGVAALDSSGAPVAQAKRTLRGYLGGLPAGARAQPVTLRPGQSATAVVEALAFDPATGSSCTSYLGLLVTVPDDTASTRLAWVTDGCAALEVHPVVAS